MEYTEDKDPCKNQDNQGKCSPQRTPDGRFALGVSGNPSGRKKGSMNRLLTMTRDAAEEVAFPLLVGAAKSGDIDAAKVLMSYGVPKMKPVSLIGEISLPEGSFTDQMKALLELVAAGEVSPSIATEIAGVISTAAKVDEITELREQVESLKKALSYRKGSKR